MKKKKQTYTDIMWGLIKKSKKALTLKELTHRFNATTGLDVPDSSLTQSLNELKWMGLVHDEAPKRECSINGITKKVWTRVE